MRTLVIGLDGYEISLAEHLMEMGKLPNMKKLCATSARYLLDHGRAKYSGLAWEHVCTGKSPEAMGRYSAVDFDSRTYRVKQRPTNAVPILRGFTSTQTVIFDMPYCDLRLAPNVQGLTSWGAHDPGVEPLSNPPSLHDELMKYFGEYPAERYIYGFVWPNPEETTKAGIALRSAVRKRTECAKWLLNDRLPNWNLAFVVVSEAHSGIEMLWHGIDPQHLLHKHPSARPARVGLISIYREIDTLIGTLVAAFPDAQVLVFSMHGMGTNNSDIAGMTLLPELLHRHRFARPYMDTGKWQTADRQVKVSQDFSWHFGLESAIPPLWEFKPVAGIDTTRFTYDRQRDYQVIEWMPTARYQPFWPLMDIFAVPAFYDGRMRVNLAGREAEGRVKLSEYASVIDDTINLLAECRDLSTGEPVLNETFLVECDPLKLDPSQADLEVTWRGTPTGFVHPKLGEIGPVPYRRPGGHSGAWGFAWCSGSRWLAGDYGVRSAFDVMPTIAEMSGQRAESLLCSGRPFHSPSHDVA